jgi:hypothetical protein
VELYSGRRGLATHLVSMFVLLNLKYLDIQVFKCGHGQLGAGVRGCQYIHTVSCPTYLITHEMTNINSWYLICHKNVQLFICLFIQVDH